MPFSPSDAARYTGLANTEARRKLWSEAANFILDSGAGDETYAVVMANSAVHADVNFQLNRRLVMRANQTPRLL